MCRIDSYNVSRVFSGGSGSLHASQVRRLAEEASQLSLTEPGPGTIEGFLRQLLAGVSSQHDQQQQRQRHFNITISNDPCAGVASAASSSLAAVARAFSKGPVDDASVSITLRVAGGIPHVEAPNPKEDSVDVDIDALPDPSLMSLMSHIDDDSAVRNEVREALFLMLERVEHEQHRSLQQSSSKADMERRSARAPKAAVSVYGTAAAPIDVAPKALQADSAAGIIDYFENVSAKSISFNEAGAGVFPWERVFESLAAATAQDDKGVSGRGREDPILEDNAASAVAVAEDDENEGRGAEGEGLITPLQIELAFRSKVLLLGAVPMPAEDLSALFIAATSQVRSTSS